MLVSAKGVFRAPLVAIERYSNAGRRLGHSHLMQFLIWLELGAMLHAHIANVISAIVIIY